MYTVRTTATSHTSVSAVLSAAFFPAAVLYGELLLRLFDRDTAFFSMALLRILLFSAAAGLAVYVILDLLPWRKVSRIAGIVIIVLGTVYTCVEYCCKSFFKTYFSVSYMGDMAGQVMSDFFGTLVEVVVARIPFILLSFVPLAAYILLRKKIFPDRGQKGAVRAILAALLVACQLGGSLLSNFGGDSSYYTYDFSANVSVPRFGMVTCLRLEAQYAIFGMPQEPLPVIDADPVFLPTDSLTQDPDNTPADDPGGEVSEEPTPVVYGCNMLDIDFAALAGEESDETIGALHRYFASLTPSQQNEYTGYFEGKNLILITAEAFSPYVISEELTPTLYKLSSEGFVFNNYYQPNWTQSTTGGEFAVMTGVIPTWIGGNQLSFRVSADNNMATALGWLFREEGYNTVAYHNNTYTYYGRDETHPNLGYDYFGIGSGLEVATNLWPNSDLEMIRNTVDGYIPGLCGKRHQLPRLLHDGQRPLQLQLERERHGPQEPGGGGGGLSRQL